MKKKILLIMLTVVFGTTMAGCGAANTVDTSSDAKENMESVQEKEQTESGQEEKEIEPSQIEEKVEEQETTDLTFADLAKKNFEFSSGAGAWSEEFTIENDGYFYGNYHDSEMGSIGEGYDNGTIYSSSYSGHFTDLMKVNDYTYKMKLADISYKYAADTEEISDNTRYIYTESYCLGSNDTFTIYLPGTPLAELSQEVVQWISMCNQSETELTMVIIVDEQNGYGIYSQDRAEPLQEAQQMFESCKQSYDYYSNKLSESSTTLEMTEYSGLEYKISDECLNYIWNLIRYNVETEQYNKILTEQRSWISEKEDKAKEASLEYEGGSIENVIYHETLATLTMERCEELIEYLK